MAESPVRRQSPERRQRIVAAARRLVLRQGLRATTMESVAAEAGIAKPTLYSYFGDKDAVFAGIVEELLAELTAGFEAGLFGPGDVVARIGAGLAAKYKAIARLLEGSPHGEELYGEHDRVAAPLFRATEERIESMVADELGKAGVARPRQLTQLLLASAYGIGRKATTAAEIGPAIRLLTERLLRPELQK